MKPETLKTVLLIGLLGLASIGLILPSSDKSAAKVTAATNSDSQRSATDQTATNKPSWRFEKVTGKTAVKGPAAVARLAIEQEQQAPMELLRFSDVTDIEDEFNLEDTWDEARYIENKQQQFESMSESEAEAKQHLLELEDQLMTAMGDTMQNEQTIMELETLFISEDGETYFSLADLNCSGTLCRIAFDLSDESDQYEIKDILAEQMPQLKQKAIEITVHSDNRVSMQMYLVVS